MTDQRSPERPAVVQPQAKFSKSNPYCYDTCPTCQGIKAKSAKTCATCRNRRPAIVQPSDPLIRHIALTKGQITVVDVVDYDRLMQWKWYASWCQKNNSYYANRKDGNRVIIMSREILRAPDEVFVDHRNRNSLDNRRCNLRLASSADNQRNRGKSRTNTSGFKGVYIDRRDGVWYSAIHVNDTKIHLGRFDSREDAARAYNEAAIRLHGEFAVLNEID